MFGGKIVKHTEGEVSESLIELLGLKAERVQAGVLAPSAPSFPLSSHDQLPAVASTSQILSDPQEVYREPLPVGAPKQSSDEPTAAVPKKDGQRLVSLIARLRAVVRINRLPHHPHILRVGFPGDFQLWWRLSGDDGGVGGPSRLREAAARPRPAPGG